MLLKNFQWNYYLKMDLSPQAMGFDLFHPEKG